MTSIFEQYYGNLLADAAYVDFGLVGPGQQVSGVDLERALTLSERFTPQQAKAFAERFDVVATADIGSFQAVTFRERPIAAEPRDGLLGETAGFGREPGRLWVACRGTEPPFSEPADLLWADVWLTLTGNAAGQDAAAATFFESFGAR